MKISILLAILAFSAIAEITKEDGVLVLTDANFNEAVKPDNKILVEFYAPWCGHCKKLAPEYAAAAQDLAKQDPPIEIAKVDATANTQLAQKYGVKGYPTLKWFVNGQPTDYTGGRTKKDIITWINKRTGPPSKQLSATELEDLISQSNFLVVFFGKEGDDFKTFEAAASTDDKRTFVHTFDADSASKHGVSGNKIVIFRKFDEPKLIYSGKFESKEISTWILSHVLPTVFELTEEYSEQIFQGKKNALFLFRDPKNNDQKSIEEEFKKAATELKGQVVFTISGTQDRLQKKIAEHLGGTSRELPVVILVDQSAGAMVKYLFTGKVNTEEIRKFLDDWKNKKLVKWTKSEEIPASNDAPVKVVVGKNFNDIVRDSTDDVLLEFYAPWCGHCKQLAPKWDQLAEELKDVKGLVIAKVDATANEIEGVSIRGFPTIKFFKNGAKRSPVDYSGDREVEGFKKWLSENSEAYKKHFEKKEDL